MSVYIDNQPIKFPAGSTPACNYDNRAFSQIVDQGTNEDRYSVFAKLDQCTEGNLLTCGEFSEACRTSWTLNSPWFYKNGVGVFRNGALTTNTPLASTEHLDEGVYRIEFTVDYGYVDQTLQTDRKTALTGGITVCGKDVSGTCIDTSDNINTIGSKVVYLNCNNGFYLNFIPNSGFDGLIKEVRAYKYNREIYLGVYSSAGAYQYHVSPTRLAYSTGTGAPYVQFRGLYSSFGLANGCYKFALVTACDLGSYLLDGEFNPDESLGTNWAYGNWSVSNGKLTHDVGYTNFILQTFSVVLGDTYTLTLTVSGLTAGSVNVYFMSAGVVRDTITVDGTYTYTQSAGTGIVKFVPTSDFNGAIDNIYVRQAVSNFEPTEFSEPFYMQTNPTCTKLLSWQNDENGLGLPWGEFASTGTLNIRAEAQLRNPRYPAESERYMDSAGIRNLIYAKSEKEWELVINDMPEYMHDALRIGILHDHFYIDNVEYIVSEGDYEPEWSNYPTMNLAKVRLKVKKKEENLLNRNI